MPGIGGTNYGTLRVRQGTAAALSAANPVLGAGEYGMSRDGTDLVLKVGDGTTAWNSLDPILPHPEGDGGGGGGGGALGFGQASPTAMTTSTVLGGGEAVPTSWSNAGGLIVPGTNGWGFAEEGWYQVTIFIWVGFQDSVPDLLRVSLQTYDVAEAAGDFAVLPPAAAGSASMGTTTSRSLPGVVATMSSPVFFQENVDVTGDSACRILMGWDDGGGTLVSANGGDPKFSLRADITKIA